MPDIIDNVKVGEYIKKLLKEHNMTQDNLADALSISKSAVSQNLRGKSSFDIQNLIQIANLFEITLDDLLNLRTEKMDEVTSEYYKVVQKGLASIQNVPAENLIISNPDLYGKVLIDYIIEARSLDMFSYLNDHKVIFVEPYYHRAKEIYLNIIQFMLEEDQPNPMDYVNNYTKLHGSFLIDEETKSLIIWGLLDKPNYQNFMSSLINIKTSPKALFSFKKEETQPIPLTKSDCLEMTAKYHLKNVLDTLMKTKVKQEDINSVVERFIHYDFLEGIHQYIDFYFKDKVSWVRKVSLNVQKAFLQVLTTKDFELIRKFAEKELFTDMTPIVRETILSKQTEVTSHLIATYHEGINFKKVGEACVQISNINLLDDMKNYLVQDDLNYLLSFVKLDDLPTLLYLLNRGARVDEKYYNLETFKKINKFIDYMIKKGE